MRAEIEKAFSPLETSPLKRKPLDIQKPASEDPVVASPQIAPIETISPRRSSNRFDPANEPAPPAREPEVNFAPKVDRRKADRRGMDALRDEALKTLISRVEDKNFGGLRNRVHWGRGMNRMRIVLVLVAVVAGGLAAYLATQTYTPAPAPVEVVAAPAVTVAAPTTQVLVAKSHIAVGEQLSADLLEWADWPDSALRPEYITVASAPDAMTEMSKSAARVQFFAGEPIRAEKLGEAGKGLLATLIDKGKRGVSVSVAAESAAGGFIVPDDRVDVVLTRATSMGQVSDTIVHNVRVLGINAQVIGGNEVEGPVSDDAPAKAESFGKEAIATLELDPEQAEVMINSTAAGRLSLVLRPTLDVAETTTAEQQATNQEIRVTSPFWAK
ncbi:Flp pilus assembly protein CpaB [Devosia sp.]|uniref:Flp pilus assembly protein CpaB n=1 Tax=Devosia sp. TaxID=1871048 RepID=UPI003BACD1D9